MQNTTQQHQFSIGDFEHWAQLAVVDPTAFESRRSTLIEAFISSLPEERQPRLRGLQWRIDQIRRTSRTPLASCIRISRMMWDSVLGDGGLHDTLTKGLMGVTDLEKAHPTPRLSAQVLLFPDRRKRR